jgi:hypothetical protein
MTKGIRISGRTIDVKHTTALAGTSFAAVDSAPVHRHNEEK